VRLIGACAWLKLSRPQQTTVPLLKTARLSSPPAPIATTLLSPGGILVCSELFHPQVKTVPSLLSRTSWLSPAAIAVTLLQLDGKGKIWGPNESSRYLPQFTGVPSFLNARLCRSPAAMVITFDKL